MKTGNFFNEIDFARKIAAPPGRNFKALASLFEPEFLQEGRNGFIIQSDAEK